MSLLKVSPSSTSTGLRPSNREFKSLRSFSMAQRRYWMQEQTGNIGNLQLKNDTIERPASGEARIAVKAVGLNFADVFIALGLYAAAPKSDVIPGLEFSGIVEEIGTVHDEPDASRTESATALKVGDQVMGVTRFGGFVSHLNAKIPLLLPIPEGWTFQEGAAFFVQGLTAMYGLRSQGNLRKYDRRGGKGQAVLVHSAAGGCGQFALAICHAYGATPFGTVSNAGKVEYLISRFPWIQKEQIIIRNASSFPGQLETALKACGFSGFDIILDAVSGEYFMPGFNSLAPGGRYIVYGAANWTPSGDKPGWLRLATQYLRRPRLDPLQMIGQNRSVMGFNLIYLFDQAESLRELALELLDLKLPPPTVAATFNFSEAQAAIRHLQSGTATGKVVLSLED